MRFKPRKNNQLKYTQLHQATDWRVSMLTGFKNAGTKITAATSTSSVNWLIVATIGVFSLLGIQLFKLQVVEGARMAAVADGNRLREKVTYAPRGRILDRNGKALAQNIASFQLVAYPYLLSQSESERDNDYREVAKILNISPSAVKKSAEGQGLTDNQPKLVEDNIPYIAALKLEQQLPKMSGFVVDGVPVRQYLSDSGLANILGYVGRISEDMLKGNPELSPVDFIGIDGVEAQYDSLLRGQNGVVKTEVDSAGRPLRTISEEPTEAGQDVNLTIDYGLQKHFAQAIKKQMQAAGVRKAAGVAIDPRTGEVLAMVSLPSYDNNLFSGGIRAGEYNRLVNNQLEPLHNKAIGGGFPPGSIIKPLHLTGALQEKVVDEHTTVYDGGQIVVPSEFDPSVKYVYKGWNPAGLGVMDARRAIAMSSDIYFYTVGGGFEGFRGLGVDRLTDYYKKYGLGSLTGIDLPGEAAGRIPTPDWKKQVKGEDWFVGDTYNISIGQGDILVSPLQMAVASAAVINGGEIIQPHVFLKAKDQGGDTKVVKQTRFIDQRFLQIAKEGMKQVIGGTTATSTFAGVPVPVAGKSGTAETDPNAGRNAHAWYTAFAPYDHPEIQFALILEEGEGGSQFAAPAIAEAMQWYFRQRN